MQDWEATIWLLEEPEPEPWLAEDQFLTTSSTAGMASDSSPLANDHSSARPPSPSSSLPEDQSTARIGTDDKAGAISNGSAGASNAWAGREGAGEDGGEGWAHISWVFIMA